jgi:membrane-associated phospholipid phosphatase
MVFARTLVALAYLQAETAAYLSMNRLGALRRSVPLLTPADRVVPLRPRSLWLYLSFVPFCLAAIHDVRSIPRMVRMMACLVLATLVSYRSFLRFPSSYPRPDVAVDDPRLAGAWRSLRAIDLPGNTFPSVHAGHAFLLALMLAPELPEEEAEARILWAILISLSTLTTKQHYLVDIAGGIVVAETVAGRIFEPWDAGRLGWRGAWREVRALCGRLDAMARAPLACRLRAGERHPRLRSVLRAFSRHGSLLETCSSSSADVHLLESRGPLVDGLRPLRGVTAVLAVASPGWIQFVRPFQEAEPHLTPEAVRAYLRELDPDLGVALRALVDFSAGGASDAASEAASPEQAPDHRPDERRDEVDESGHPEPAAVPLGGIP